MYNRSREYITKMSKKTDEITQSQILSIADNQQNCDEKPGLLKFRIVCSRQLFLYSLYAVFLLLGFIGYYLYLDALYLVDEIMETGALRELALEEKFTIRTTYTGSMDELKSFVAKYSLCETVHEINILWTSDSKPPTLDQFKFAHTHSRVSFDWYNWKTKSSLKDSAVYFDTQTIATEGNFEILSNLEEVK